MIKIIMLIMLFSFFFMCVFAVMGTLFHLFRRDDLERVFTILGCVCLGIIILLVIILVFMAMIKLINNL